MTAVTDIRSVDRTLFVQILNAYNARNPRALISDAEYHECLEQLVNDEAQDHDGHLQQNTSNFQRNCGLQERLGTKLIVKNKEAENVLVAGSQTRHLELIPFSRVYTALEEFTALYTDECQLQQVVRDTVLGIPEEIVQEYCDMASSHPIVIDDQQEEKETNDSRRCLACSVQKSVEEFLQDEKEPSGLRTRCKDCDPRTRHKKKVKIYPGEQDFIPNANKAADSSPLGFSGTAICAACGMRKSAAEYDKERSKPLAIRCKACVKNGTPLRSKTCSSCQRDLTLDHFYRDSYTKAGFRPRCMQCMRARKANSRIVDGKPTINAQPLSPSQRNLQNMNEDLDQEQLLVDSQIQKTPSTPQQKRCRRRRRKASTGNTKTTIDNTPSPRTENKQEEYLEDTSTGRGKSRQRSRTATRITELMTDEATPASTLSTRSRTDTQNAECTPPIQPLKRPVRNRERSKHVSGTAVRDKYGNLRKYCTGCLQFKLTQEFGRDCSKASGLRSRCRNCQRRSNRPNTVAPILAADTNEVPIAVRKTPRKPNRRRKTGLKICSKCDLEKSRTEFYRDRTQTDGLSSTCKRCSNASKNRLPEKRVSSKTTTGKQKQCFGPQVPQEDIDRVLEYVDALLPESSEDSAGIGEFPEEEEIESSSAPECLSHRVCVGCKVDKNWIEFNLNPGLPAGLCPLCKDCLRGNGMSGRRAIKQRPKKRRCVRCKRPRSSIHFAHSVFFPNRITRVCDTCRGLEQSGGANKRDRDGLCKALDVMDFECDALRLRDPGGGEKLWRDLKSDSELEEHEQKRRKLKQNSSRKNALSNTAVEHKNDVVKLTQHLPAESWIPCRPLPNPEVSLLRDEKKRRRPVVLEKQCKLCGETKPVDGFAHDSSKACRLSPHCIECSKLGL